MRTRERCITKMYNERKDRAQREREREREREGEREREREMRECCWRADLPSRTRGQTVSHAIWSINILTSPQTRKLARKLPRMLASHCFTASISKTSSTTASPLCVPVQLRRVETSS